MRTMRILVVNPNTSVAMTEKIGAAARTVAAPGTEIVAVNPADSREVAEDGEDWPRAEFDRRLHVAGESAG